MYGLLFVVYACTPVCVQREDTLQSQAATAGMNLDGLGSDITSFLAGNLSTEEMIAQRSARKADTAGNRTAAPPPPPK